MHILTLNDNFKGFFHSDPYVIFLRKDLVALSSHMQINIIKNYRFLSIFRIIRTRPSLAKSIFGRYSSNKLFVLNSLNI